MVSKCPKFFDSEQPNEDIADTLASAFLREQLKKSRVSGDWHITTGEKLD